MGGEYGRGSVLGKEARGHRLLLVFVWCSPHQEGTASVVRPDSDPKVALLQPLRITEAALDHRRIAC